MNNSGDAAEQVVRMSLETGEVALKLTGSAAKNIAAAIYAVLKNRDKNKLKGRQRLTSMLKSGKELKVFTVSEQHLKQFAAEAKRYGVVYCALRSRGKSEDGLVDIMVRAEDASKINRIVDRFKLSTVDAVSIKQNVNQSGAEKVPDTPDITDYTSDKLIDDVMSVPDRSEANTRPNLQMARMDTERSDLFAPTSETQDKAAVGSTKHSVRDELREIMQQRQRADKSRSEVQSGSGRTSRTNFNQHYQMIGKKRKKSKVKMR